MALATGTPIGILGGSPVWVPLAIVLGVGIGLVGSMPAGARGELITPTLVFGSRASQER